MLKWNPSTNVLGVTGTVNGITMSATYLVWPQYRLTLSCNSITTNATAYSWTPIVWTAVENATSSTTFNESWAWASGSTLTSPDSGFYSMNCWAQFNPTQNRNIILAVSVNGVVVRSHAQDVFVNNAFVYEPALLSATIYLDSGDIIQYGMFYQIASTGIGISATNKIFSNTLRLSSS
jgi:hypothetical protein